MRPIEPTQAGLYCPSGAFYIRVRPVARALVTHAHSNHARSGHEAVLATAETLDLMRLRFGEDFAGTTQAVGYGETVRLDGVSVMFHPAGHVIGSAQIAVVRGTIRIVVSGDYKNVADPFPAGPDRLGADWDHSDRRLRRLQERRRSVLRSARAGPLRCLHHRGDFGPSGFPPCRSEGRARQALRLGQHLSRACPSPRCLRARQGAARHGDVARPATISRFIFGALEAITSYYAGRGINLGDVKLARGAFKADLAGAMRSARRRRSRTCGPGGSPTLSRR
jgi:putative mRNA 3-end processing factor